MTRLEAWLLHVATLLVGGGGLVYAWMRFFVRPADPFAVVNHPWQPEVQHLHVLAAPLLVFAIGLIWKAHVWPGVRLRIAARRKSGLALFATAAPMIASGYLLQTATDPSWRQAWLVIHLVASGLWLGGYLAHQLSSRLVGRPAPDRPSRPSESTSSRPR
jgi:hypothetical protein